MTDENKERLIAFNDYFGKKVVKQHLLEQGISEDKIFDTKKYCSVDFIIQMEDKIFCIEIKNRYCPNKFYKNLKAFGLQDDKHTAIEKFKEELEEYHQKKVIVSYVNLTQDEFVYHNLSSINIKKLEVQERETQNQTGSNKKAKHLYYQLPYSTGKKNKIKKIDMDERDDFFSRSSWE